MSPKRGGRNELCWQLAESFLTDAGVKDPKVINDLAQQIQDKIEDFIEWENGLAVHRARKAAK